MRNRYPIYIISKGRYDSNLTARAFLRDGIDFHLVVEPQEVELYQKALPDAKILSLPFQNLGKGSIPARNWCWEYSISKGAQKHWIFDDNINGMSKYVRGKRIKCDGKEAIDAIEKFSDKYSNLAISGMNYVFFMIAQNRKPPFHLNTRVYSNLLIRNELKFRWRGRYNEDTDLCLQVLSAGYCTALINQFLINKAATMTMKGGNSDELYKDDGRFRMAYELQVMWPKIVKISYRWGRPQHYIDYKKHFSQNKLKRL